MSIKRLIYVYNFQANGVERLIPVGNIAPAESTALNEALVELKASIAKASLRK